MAAGTLSVPLKPHRLRPLLHLLPEMVIEGSLKPSNHKRHQQLTHIFRRLAIGLENGEVMIYWGLFTSPADWHLDETVSSRWDCSIHRLLVSDGIFRLAHVDHIHRMAWRPSSTNPDELATCSEDGTLRILKHRFLSY